MTKAQQAEATDGLLAVEYNGETYHVDPTAMTWETLEADAAMNYSRVISDMLGDDEFARFKAKNPKPLVRDADGDIVVVAAEMRTAIIGAMGNSGASSGS